MAVQAKSGYAEHLAEALPRVRDSMEAAADRSGRTSDEVRLVAVTKGHPVAAVEAAVEAGLRDLGENRVGELEEKVVQVDDPEVRWHMIGHLQRRKAPRALAVTDLIHSVDSRRLAERLSRVLSRDDGNDALPGSADVLFQVNTSGEEAKYGFELDGAEEEVAACAELPGLRPRGLMTMAPYTDDEAVLHATFRRLRELAERLRSAVPDFGPELSMGMTNDLEIAVEEGSTMVRLGTALFGDRPGG